MRDDEHRAKREQQRREARLNRLSRAMRESVELQRMIVQKAVARHSASQASKRLAVADLIGFAAVVGLIGWLISRG